MLLPRKCVSIPGAALRADGNGSAAVGRGEGKRLALTADLAIEAKLKLVLVTSPGTANLRLTADAPKNRAIFLDDNLHWLAVSAGAAVGANPLLGLLAVFLGLLVFILLLLLFFVLLGNARFKAFTLLYLVGNARMI